MRDPLRVLITRQRNGWSTVTVNGVVVGRVEDHANTATRTIENLIRRLNVIDVEVIVQRE